jgi:hypothetical protein
MKMTTCLVLEEQDFTRDMNLKREAFDAFTKADLVVHEGRVIKTGAVLVSQPPQEPVKRTRRVKAPKPTIDAPQDATEPEIGQPTEAEEESGACVMGGSCAY